MVFSGAATSSDICYSILPGISAVGGGAVPPQPIYSPDLSRIDTTFHGTGLDGVRDVLSTVHETVNTTL